MLVLAMCNELVSVKIVLAFVLLFNKLKASVQTMPVLVMYNGQVSVNITWLVLIMSNVQVSVNTMLSPCNV